MDSEKERRALPRYALKSDMQYRVTDPGSPSAWVKGKTINMNSDSVLFSAEDAPRVGQHVEVRMRWPLHGPPDGGGELRLRGIVSWASDGRCAISLLRHEVLSTPAA